MPVRQRTLGAPAPNLPGAAACPPGNRKRLCHLPRPPRALRTAPQQGPPPLGPPPSHLRRPPRALRSAPQPSPPPLGPPHRHLRSPPRALQTAPPTSPTPLGPSHAHGFVLHRVLPCPTPTPHHLHCAPPPTPPGLGVRVPVTSARLPGFSLATVPCPSISTVASRKPEKVPLAMHDIPWLRPWVNTWD